MANIVKKISAPYNILAADGASPTVVTVGDPLLNNSSVTINGNLTITGSEYFVNSLNSSVANSDIVLNARLPGGNVGPAINASITVDRGITGANVALKWNELIQEWQVTNDGVNYYSVATTNTGYIKAVIEDPAPYLGGNLTVNGFNITSNSNVVFSPNVNTQIDSVIQIQELAVPPAANIAGYNLLHANTPDSGGTGLFVTNDRVANEELVSKRKAIVFSLIF